MVITCTTICSSEVDEQAIIGSGLAGLAILAAGLYDNVVGLFGIFGDFFLVTSGNFLVSGSDFLGGAGNRGINGSSGGAIVSIG